MSNMGCIPSDTAQMSAYPKNFQQSNKLSTYPEETIVQAYIRLDATINEIEADSPSPRLSGVLPMLHEAQEEIMKNEETFINLDNGEEIYDEPLTQVIIDLKLDQYLHLIAEHEEFVANINRQAIKRITRSLIEGKFNELKENKKKLEVEVNKLQYLYKEQDILLERVLGEQYGSIEERSIEASLSRARALRDTLAVGVRAWRSAAAAAVRAHSLASSAFLSWQLISQAKDVSEKVRLGTEARNGLVAGGYEVQSAQNALPAAPFPHCTTRQLQALSLTIDYMFTDMYSNERYKHATRVFSGFNERTLSLASWITDTLKTSLEKDLKEVENDVDQLSKELRAVRVNLIAEKGLTDVIYKAPNEFANT